MGNENKITWSKKSNKQTNKQRSCCMVIEFLLFDEEPFMIFHRSLSNSDKQTHNCLTMEQLHSPFLFSLSFSTSVPLSHSVCSPLVCSIYLPLSSSAPCLSLSLSPFPSLCFPLFSSLCLCFSGCDWHQTPLSRTGRKDTWELRPGETVHLGLMLSSSLH